MDFPADIPRIVELPHRGACIRFSPWLASAGLHLACWGVLVAARTLGPASPPTVAGPRAAATLQASIAQPLPAPAAAAFELARDDAVERLESRTESHRRPSDRVPPAPLTSDELLPVAVSAAPLATSPSTSRTPRVLEHKPVSALLPAPPTRSVAAAPDIAARAEVAMVGTVADRAVQATFSPSPVYPERARRERRQGTVRVTAQVSETGAVSEVRVAQSCGHADLDQAAVEALRQWRFDPARRGGAPVARSIVLPVIFTLE